MFSYLFLFIYLFHFLMAKWCWWQFLFYFCFDLIRFVALVIAFVIRSIILSVLGQMKDVDGRAGGFSPIRRYVHSRSMPTTCFGECNSNVFVVIVVDRPTSINIVVVIVVFFLIHCCCSAGCCYDFCSCTHVTEYVVRKSVSATASKLSQQTNL